MWAVDTSTLAHLIMSEENFSITALTLEAPLSADKGSTGWSRGQCLHERHQTRIHRMAF